MKNRVIGALAAATAAFSTLGAVTALPTVAGAQSVDSPPSAADFARVPALDQVRLSPDGKHIAALTPAGSGNQISIWRTEALNEPARVLSAPDRNRYISLAFLKNDRLLVTAIQTFTSGNQKTHLTKQYVTDFDGKAFRSLMPAGRAGSETEAFYNSIFDFEIIDRLPLDPQNVIAVDHRLDGEGDIYKINVYTGRADRLIRGSEKFGEPITDLKGEVRAKVTVDYEDGKVYFGQWIKNPANEEWEEHFRWYAKDREPVTVVGFDADPNIVYVLTNKGREKAALLTYDVRKRQMGEPLFEHKLFDVAGMVRSRAAADYGRILGFAYQGETLKYYWVDPKVKAVADSLRAPLGLKTTTVDWTDPGDPANKARLPVLDGADAQVIGISDDLQRALIEKSGPSQPSVFFLVDNGRITQLGESRPWIKPATLGQTRLIQYTARDGLIIPAFLTTPPAKFGPGPHPAFILPHGGPWARDNLDWDISGWTQYFASRGYVVLQPQFRGSEGWGQKLWRAGDGEWGGKMQDDKDDGAKWLIDQKLAAPDRIAMFGYSYGGYAALAATIRPNGLYQCAVSGAGAGDLASIRRATFDNRYQREFQNPTIAGLDALARAKEAKIPVLIYHGDRDQTVELQQSKKFADALRSAGLPHKFVEIKDMGHSYATMLPSMVELQLVEIEKYLKTDCGPGGL